MKGIRATIEKYWLEIVTVFLIVLFTSVGVLFGMRTNRSSNWTHSPKVVSPTLYQYAPPIEPDSD